MDMALGALTNVNRRRPAGLVLDPRRPASPSGQLIVLKERGIFMLKNDLILRNPLRLLETDNKEILPPGSFGAVLARAGVGKTALIVQIALNTLLNQKNVLHISLNEPVGKVNLWYQEVFERLAHHYNVPQINQLWDSIIPHRFIMTFRVEGFSAPKLEERLTDLTTQNIFIPHMIIIDGLPFEAGIETELPALKALAGKYGLPVWFTITTHRHETPSQDGLPVQLHRVQDLFEATLLLQPGKETIHIHLLKGTSGGSDQVPLTLDPETMLIQQKE
jgi:hypothetical protein